MGHENVKDEESLVERVTSKALHPGKTNRTSHDWWAINAEDLDNLSEVDFLKLIIEVLESGGYTKKHVIIVGTPSRTNRTDVLKKKKNVDVIIFPKGLIDPAPIFPFPHPWPSPSPIRPGPTDPDSDWNAVPGFPDTKCRPGIVVCPVVDCDRLGEVEWNPRPWGIPDDLRIFELDDRSLRSLLEEDCFGNENQHRWKPDINIGHQYVPGHKPLMLDDVWGMIHHCFCNILREGFLHVLHCYLAHKGTKNNTVVVELTEVGRLLGLDSHPCVECFVEKINSLSDYGTRQGWPGIMVSIRFS